MTARAMDRTVVVPLSRRLMLPLWTAAALSLPPAATAHEDIPAPKHVITEVMRIGFAGAVFADMNSRDGEASIRVWGQALGRKGNVFRTLETTVLDDTEQTRRAMVEGKVDFIGLPTYEYFKIQDCALPGELMTLVMDNDEMYEEFLILVGADASGADLPDLRGKKLIFLDTIRTSLLAEAWVNATLAKLNLPTMWRFFGGVSKVARPSRAVLPVFFGQADACLVTRSAFETMCELNPQIGAKVRVAAASMPVVPTVFCCRKDIATDFKDAVFQIVRDMGRDPYGQQVLITFKASKLVDIDESNLATARDLARENERLLNADAREYVEGRTAQATLK
jgi:ABC-type phosphate/phosphonate transport system substrate-binding protein